MNQSAMGAGGRVSFGDRPSADTLFPPRRKAVFGYRRRTGIGLAAAAALSQAGASVVLLARGSIEIKAAVEATRSKGGKASSRSMDVGATEAVRAYLASEEPFDVLVNNAGTNRPAAFQDVTTEDFDAVLGLNLRAAFFVAQAVARRQIEVGVAGSIINLSSQMGHVGAARRTVYCASKHAMEGLTKAMAIDLAPYGSTRQPRHLLKLR